MLLLLRVSCTHIVPAIILVIAKEPSITHPAEKTEKAEEASEVPRRLLFCPLPLYAFTRFFILRVRQADEASTR